jgi:ubiquinone/menaquinone biosynthesis C-methylase UbiE
MTESIAFDRAAEFYDRTRALPGAAMDALVADYATELRARGRCLEIGVGTGRIAVPVQRAGVELVGIDLSAAMLVKLVEKCGGAVPVVRGDATRLPYRDRAFGGVYFVHVLHLVPNWQDAVREAVRVVRPDGVLMYDTGHWSGVVGDLYDEFQRSAGITKRHVGLDDVEPLDELLTAMGARVRMLPPIAVDTPLVPGTMLRNIAENKYSWTWRLDPETLARATEHTRGWARERFGDIGAPVPGGYTIELRAYDLP